MLRHQEVDQRGVGAIKAVIAAKPPRVAAAEIAVIAAAALGDVVKDRSDIKQPRLVEIRHQLAAQRIFVRVLGQSEPAQIAQDLQDVLVDRVDVKQIVLHLPDDAAEHGEVTPEHRQIVHAAQLVQHALRLLQQRDERCAIGRIAPVACVDPHARVPQRAHQLRRHPFELAVLSHD